MNKTTKIIIGIVIILLVIVGVWYGASKQQKEEGVIRIGFIAPLTGPFADWGRTIEEGLQISLENTKHKFSVDFQDDVCDPKQGVTIANYFLNVEKIKLIIGPGCIESLKPIAPISDQKNALLFSTGLLDEEVFEKHQSVINLASQISSEGKYLAKYLSSQNVKRVAIVHGMNPFGVEHSKRLPIFLENFDIKVSSIQGTSLDASDFRTVILKIMNTEPDAIFIHQGEKQIGIFVKQTRELGYKIPIYGYYGSEAQSVIEAGREALEGMFYTYPVNRAEGTLAKQNFEKRYKEKFGSDKVPSTTSFFVYDGMMLLDMALDSCHSSDITCIKNFFKGREYNGISGEMRFEENGSITRPFGIKKIENGKFIWVTKEINL